MYTCTETCSSTACLIGVFQLFVNFSFYGLEVPVMDCTRYVDNWYQCRRG
eukprot:NODE_7644_length_234_cov_33.708108_g7561_i0.p1 GENE.NODE_7644_length_234_cov_33.708108_g7561_i0~~NODE_7644_length_234_cov_33.708108_g7561_i0.p1  ORF type:complete len:60 (-),score=2.82 NODE_7644_length_234_cov_33.708108_g7561_i0:55-204(-)